MLEMITPANVTAIGSLVVVLWLVAFQNPRERDMARRDYLSNAAAQREDYVKSLKTHHDDSKKDMADARADYLGAEREARAQFLSALKEQTDRYERLTILDHDARHAMANKVGGLAMLLAQAGFPVTEVPPHEEPQIKTHAKVG